MWLQQCVIKKRWKWIPDIKVTHYFSLTFIGCRVQVCDCEHVRIFLVERARRGSPPDCGLVLLVGRCRGMMAFAICNNSTWGVGARFEGGEVGIQLVRYFKYSSRDVRVSWQLLCCTIAILLFNVFAEAQVLDSVPFRIIHFLQSSCAFLGLRVSQQATVSLPLCFYS